MLNSALGRICHLEDRQREEGSSRAAIKINEAPVVGVSLRPSLRGDERRMFEEKRPAVQRLPR